MAANPVSEPVNLTVALAHPRRGRPVFPCDQATKRPSVSKRLGGRGFHDATTDEARIRAWWSQYPDAIVGMPTGVDVGVFVLDINVKEGQVGEETLEQLQKTFGKLPDTAMVLTATGGQHLYFRHPRDGREIPNKGGMLGRGTETWGREGYPEVPFKISPGGLLITPGVDVRGDGGYVILPGSVMRKGRSYEWEASSDPDEGDAEIAQAPDWLLELVVCDPKADRPSAPSGESAPIEQGRRNEALFSLGRSLRAKGLTETGIVAALLAENSERCVPPLPEAEVRATVHSAASKAPGRSAQYDRPPEPDRPPLAVVGGTAHDPWPVIRLVAGELGRIVDQSVNALVAADLGIYLHGRRLVRIADANRLPKQKWGLVRLEGGPILTELTPDGLAYYLANGLALQKYNERKKAFLPSDPPDRLARLILTRANDSPFPVLTGFIESPTLLPDGSQITKPGYDVNSGLYLVDGPWGAPIGTVDRAAATMAADYLSTLTKTFPFVDGGDESAVVAAMMTAVYRRALPAAPHIAITASTPATGKSLLADCIAIIATGRRAPVMGLGGNEEEAEKRLGTVLMDGDAVMSIDNISRPVRNDLLCRMGTQPMESVRVLGKTKKVLARTNVAFILTGNNLSLVGDLLGRTLLIRMESGLEHPEERVFTRDALAHMRHHRARAIRAILTITKAFFDSGEQVDAVADRFDDWRRMVRSPLIWAGLPDPFGPARGLPEQDRELQAMATLYALWWEHWGHEPKLASEIIRWAQEGSGASELEDVAGIIAGGSGRLTPHSLGRRFSTWQGRPVRGYRLVPAGTYRKAVRWLIEPVKN